jgi:hypothetical protein
MAVNNNGHLLDDSGNVAVDFVWGPFPVQPNDERAGAVTPANIGGGSGDYAWSATTRVASGRLDPALDNHANVEAGWANYPSYTPAAGNFIVTAVSGNGTTVTYTSQNNLAAGDVVNITGLTASAYNLSSATVVTANKLKFTVTNSANAGEITGQYGKVQSTTAASGGDGAGVGYIVVPSVIGTTTAVALDSLKDAGYEVGNITTAAAATNAAKSISAASRTAGSNTLTLTTGAAHGYSAGQLVTITSVDASANGTWIVSGGSGTTLTVGTTPTSALSLTGLTGSVVAVAGTIKTQSTAAGASSVATSATITITPWASAS